MKSMKFHFLTLCLFLCLYCFLPCVDFNAWEKNKYVIGIYFFFSFWRYHITITISDDDARWAKLWIPSYMDQPHNKKPLQLITAPSNGSCIFGQTGGCHRFTETNAHTNKGKLLNIFMKFIRFIYFQWGSIIRKKMWSNFSTISVRVFFFSMLPHPSKSIMRSFPFYIVDKSVFFFVLYLSIRNACAIFQAKCS